MSLVDVTQPVVINATTSILRESSEHLRRTCIVSYGMSELEVGKFKELYSYDWQNYIKPYTEIREKFTSFFSLAPNKSVVLLELGQQIGTPLTSTYDVLLNYCEKFNKFSLTDFYKYIYEQKWIDKDTDETKDVLIAFFNWYQPSNPFNEELYEQWAELNQKPKDNKDTYKEYFTLQLPKNWYSSYYEYLAKESNEFKALLILENLQAYVSSLANEQAFFNQTAYDIYLEERGTKETDYADKVKALNEFISEGLYPCYIYVLPRETGLYENLASELFKQYEGLNQTVYFFLDFTTNDFSIFESSTAFQQIKNSKSAALFVNNTIGQDLSALVAGLFSSSMYDLKQSNPASPFNYKTLAGVKFTPITSSAKKQLTQASVNFVDQISSSIVLLNGRYGDTTPIDYRYQWDFTSFNIESDLKRLILNGVNNPLYVVKYNQAGIDVIKSRVKTTLSNMIAVGAVAEYAQNLNAANGVLEGLNEIMCIDFRPYIEANPEHYEQEIYGGISFYLRIGRYIRQVVLNVTLG